MTTRQKCIRSSINSISSLQDKRETITISPRWPAGAMSINITSASQFRLHVITHVLRLLFAFHCQQSNNNSHNICRLGVVGILHLTRKRERSLFATTWIEIQCNTTENTNQVAGCQNRHKPNKLATLWKTNKQTHTHITQKVKTWQTVAKLNVQI